MALNRSRLIVQSDWKPSLSVNNGSAWITFKEFGKQGIQGKISRNREGTYECTNGFGLELVSEASTNPFNPRIWRNTIKHSNCLSVSYKDEVNQIRCRYQAPATTFDKLHAAKKNIVCVDVTAGGLGASCDNDGKLIIWTTENGEIRRNLSGHYADVNVCKFFPSGVVLLSGGADTLVKIWSAETGQCAATLKGHQAGVNDIDIVEKGRNVVSVSRDGTARLWDVGQSSCITTFSDLSAGPINCCSLANTDSGINLGSASQPSGDREVLTEGKMLIVGTESGSLQGLGLKSREKIFDLSVGSAVNCCAFLSDSSVLCGTQESRLVIVDLRNTSKPLAEYQESRSAILSVLPHSGKCYITTGDGSCYLVDSEIKNEIELTGSDCDPVYKVVTDGTYLYTACRDGCIRKYDITKS